MHIYVNTKDRDFKMKRLELETISQECNFQWVKLRQYIELCIPFFKEHFILRKEEIPCIKRVKLTEIHGGYVVVRIFQSFCSKGAILGIRNLRARRRLQRSD